MRTPELYSADQLKHWDIQGSVDGKKWFSARPLSRYGWNVTKRIKLAWFVLIGNYDAVKWEL